MFLGTIEMASIDSNQRQYNSGYEDFAGKLTSLGGAVTFA